MDTIDRSKLPKELVAQLSKKGLRDGMKSRLLNILNEDTVMSLDEILVAYWKKHGEIIKRSSSQSAIYALRRAGLVESASPGLHKRIRKDGVHLEGIG